jgi:ABC-type sugar transport system ATPase subunit
MEGQLLLRTQELSKVFGITTAVNKVNFEVYAGEVHGLIGENGSGKSTLSSMITGISPQSSGKMYYEGKEYSPKNQIEANSKGVSIIVQEMSTIESLTVAENIFFGNENMFLRCGTVNKSAMNAKAKEYLAAFGLGKINPAHDISECTFEERKLIELVRATYFNPKILVVDETTTALSQEGREKLFSVMKDLKEKGTAIIMISHNLQEVLEHCDRITVLRDGVLVNSFVNKDKNENDLKSYMIGRELSHKYYREDSGKDIPQEAVLEADGICIKGQLDDIGFKLYRGEILGIGGLTESGMHELGKVLFGAIKPEKGTVRLVEKDLKINDIGQAIKNDIAYTSKNRDQEGLIVQSSIKDNVCISALDKLNKLGLISPRKEKKFTECQVTKLQLKMENIGQYVSALSGGNKQKVVLSKWLARDSKILILDSPTRGIDVMVKASIYDLMQKLTEEGRSIIMISEELSELIGMCDRLLVMKDGHITGELQRCDVFTEEKIIHLMI